MEEFDLNFDTNMGTSVSKLKNNINNSESDIDYDKILDKLEITETNDKPLGRPSEQPLDKPREQSNAIDISRNNQQIDSINMNHFARKLENKLDNIKKDRDRELFSDIKRLPPKVENIKPIPPKKPINKPVAKTEETNIPFQHKDLIIYIVLFLMLNSKLLIELIYDKLPFTRERPYPNLIIRGLIFGGLLFLIKKFNLNS